MWQFYENHLFNTNKYSNPCCTSGRRNNLPVGVDNTLRNLDKYTVIVKSWRVMVHSRLKAQKDGEMDLLSPECPGQPVLPPVEC